jgi:3-hydroxyisobutyrate dehydrogenase-like beta-hydroxyacid dehydrogenase
VLIGLLHPGAMGTAVGSCLLAAGHEVGWASTGRGEQTHRRATDAGFTDHGTVDELLAACPVVLSIAPPHGALELARRANGYQGMYVDANAVSPDTAEQIAGLIVSGGGRFVDGGIIGLPPTRTGMTRLYLSGPDAPAVVALFAGSFLDARSLGSAVSAASALKMAYAAWSKGSGALLLTVRASARVLGVEDALVGEWALSQPGLAERSEQVATAALEKAWRWTHEFAQVADTFDAVGLPGDFGRAAEQLYARFPRPTPLPRPTPPTDGPRESSALADVLQLLTPRDR